MISDTIARVNQLRKQAMANPEFIKEAKSHQQAIAQESLQHSVSTYKSKKRNKKKSLSDIYQDVSFNSTYSDTQH